MIITTQSASLKLVQEFNKQFTDFVCENPEIHISYSLTNFKDSTPIRLVAEISETNQEEVKYKLKNSRRDSFSAEENKAGTMIFDTILKNERYSDLLSWVEQMRKWVEEEKNPVSKGTLYNLLVISYILKKFDEKKDYSRLIWHPIFTHYINRVLKNKNDQYKVAEIEEFFDRVLSINKEDKNALKLKEILHPLVCEVIYKTRKIKKENLYA
jgi:CRISPR/Cas system-associated protein Cas10 (large subunit of type III CRISPR-Cas system)